MALCAPETAGPWSATIWMTSSMKWAAYSGSSFLNHNRPMTPPIPIFRSRTSDSFFPAYNSSSPLSSDIVQMNVVGLRISPVARALL